MTRFYVLDTNFFFNLEIKSEFGMNPVEIISSITDYARRLKTSEKADFYMPPRILDEMLTFVSPNEPFMKAFMAEIHIKAPDQAKTQLSTSAFYELVDEIRHRSYRGLQVAEEEMEAAVKAFQGVDIMTSKIEYQKAMGEHTRRLRERYRNATRTKFLDSIADLDVIVLAKELDGYVVTADEGVLLWARKFGAKEVVPAVLRHELDSLLQA